MCQPLAIALLADAVEGLWEALPHHSVSLTGGEPLMQGKLWSSWPSSWPGSVGR